MTTALSNVSAIWVDTNTKVGIGYSVVDIGQNTQSRIIKLKANGNTVFDVSVSGFVNANAYFANSMTSVSVTSNVSNYVIHTVANLPSAATAGSGARAFVSDSMNVAFYQTVVGGGANAVPVFSNGTAWMVG